MIFITLGGGFRGHHVGIELDGRSVFDESDVRSSPLVDRAGKVPPISAQGDTAGLKVTVTEPDAGRPVVAQQPLDTERDQHVLVYLDHNSGDGEEIRIIVRDRPLGFA